MVNKKGYLRTLEVSFAVLLTISALVFVFSQPRVASDDLPPAKVLNSLEFNPDFRSCVLENNISCTSNLVNNSLSTLYRNSFSITITDYVNYIPDNLPEKRVYAESIIISGSVETYSPKIVKLFYWV